MPLLSFMNRQLPIIKKTTKLATKAAVKIGLRGLCPT
jgi:hypothetical protein